MFCEEQCECPSVYEPVECYNFRTGTLQFNNQCIASCEGGFSDYQCERVQQNSSCDFCPEVYSPVVCDDDTEYSNSCKAECEGKTGCRPRGQQIDY